MSLNCGIAGLPNVGKSTLFNCLTRAEAHVANFPFSTVDPNLGIAPVPDKRLKNLASIVKPQKVTPATVEVVDIAGLVKGAHKGEGLGNQFLGYIRETNAILHVLRCFDDENIIHTEGIVNPVKDKETVDYELMMKDLETVEKKINKIERAAKSGDKTAFEEYKLLSAMRAHLLHGFPARTFHTDRDKDHYIRDCSLLTAKPALYVCNVDERSASAGNKYVQQVMEVASKEGSGIAVISASIESDIAGLTNDEERKLFLDDMGLKESGTWTLIRKIYDLLNLITFYTTTGSREVRAWPVQKGTNAWHAAGIIHTDFAKNFIRAEVIKYDDFIKFGSEHSCRDAGKMLPEGKEYLIQDGDVVHFRVGG